MDVFEQYYPAASENRTAHVPTYVNAKIGPIRVGTAVQSLGRRCTSLFPGCAYSLHKSPRVLDDLAAIATFE